MRAVYGRGAGRNKRTGEMNALEKRYAAHLEERRLAGEVLEYAFEVESLRLAKRTTYTPDFRVLLADGTVEMHEVKPRSGDSYYALANSKTKIKVAAELHPYVFRIVWPTKEKAWASEVVA